MRVPCRNLLSWRNDNLISYHYLWWWWCWKPTQAINFLKLTSESIKTASVSQNQVFGTIHVLFNKMRDKEIHYYRIPYCRLKCHHNLTKVWEHLKKKNSPQTIWIQNINIIHEKKATRKFKSFGLFRPFDLVRICQSTWRKNRRLESMATLLRGTAISRNKSVRRSLNLLAPEFYI